MADHNIFTLQDKFNAVYGEVDNNRKPEHYWLAISDHLSRVGESIRKDDFPGILHNASHAFAWMCEYINCLNKCFDNTDQKYIEFALDDVSLSEIVGLKYPLVCGHCGDKPCTCNAEKMDKKDDKSIPIMDEKKQLYEKWVKNREEIKQYSISQWLETFQEIYQNNIRLQSLSTIGFHLLEETGEEARAIRHLLQLRDITNPNHPTYGDQKDKIDKTYVLSLTNIPKLVSEYKTTKFEFDKKSPGLDEPSRKAKIRTGTDLYILKYRLVRAKMELLNEFADTFAWFSSVMIKVLNMVETMDEAGWLSRQVNSTYDILDVRISHEYDISSHIYAKARCHSCEDPKCKCKYFLPVD